MIDQALGLQPVARRKNQDATSEKLFFPYPDLLPNPNSLNPILLPTNPTNSPDQTNPLKKKLRNLQKISLPPTKTPNPKLIP